MPSLKALTGPPMMLGNAAAAQLRLRIEAASAAAIAVAMHASALNQMPRRKRLQCA